MPGVFGGDDVDAAGDRRQHLEVHGVVSCPAAPECSLVDRGLRLVERVTERDAAQILQGSEHAQGLDQADRAVRQHTPDRPRALHLVEHRARLWVRIDRARVLLRVVGLAQVPIARGVEVVDERRRRREGDARKHDRERAHLVEGEAARSTHTEPGFMFASASSFQRIGAFFPGMSAVVMTMSTSFAC